MRQDVIYAVRGLWRRPAFAVAAIVTLALGIGANAAIFSVVNAVLLRPLPYPRAERLMMVWTYNPRQGFDKDVGTYPNFADWRRDSRSFERLAAYTGASYTLTGSGDPLQIRGAVVTPGFFETMGVSPLRGRVIASGDATTGGHHVVVLSHGLWVRRFGGDAGVVGRSLPLSSVSHEVIGIMPEGFAHPEDAELWTPLAPTDAFAEVMQSRGSFWLTVMGRLRADVEQAAAQAEMDAIAARLERQHRENAGLGVRLVPLHEEIVGDVRRPLLVLLGAVGFVLLIACANVANLLLTRAAARQRELAVRAALGAGRARIARQLLTESIVLALLGGAAGLLLAAWAVDLLHALAPAHVPRLSLVRVDATVLAYAAAASVVTGVVFGLAPVSQSSSTADALKDGARGGSDGARGRRLRSALAIAEIAVALVLVVGAGLLVRSFVALNRVDLGFETRGLLALRLQLPRAAYPKEEQVAAFYQRLTERIRALPGVESAAAASSILLPALPQSAGVIVENRPADTSSGARVPVPYDAVTPEFFDTLGIPVVKGRRFTAGDAPGGLPVVMVNEAFERRYFPDRDALGRRVGFGTAPAPDTTWYTIVGVVRDTRRAGVDRAPWAEMYFPHTQAQDPAMFVILRSSGDPLSLAAAAQAAVWSLDRNQPVSSVRTLRDMVDRTQANRRFTTLLLLVFACVALALAAVGVYGVIAYSTAQRTQEIGIRMALGAGRSDVLRLVLGEGAKIALIGLGIGVAGAALASRLLTGLLFGVPRWDPMTFAAVPVLLLAVAAIASWIPARRAVRLDPVTAMRTQG